MLLAQDLPVDREGILESLRSSGVLALAVKLFSTGILSTSLRQPILDRPRTGDQSLVSLQVPPGVSRLPVVLPSEADQQIELLPHRWDRLGDPTRLEVLVDRLAEFLDPLLPLRVRITRGRGPGLLAEDR